MTQSVFTIGYEGLVQPQLIDLLSAACVQTVLDVRAVPQSRKPGFSKTLLAATLQQAGIGYTLDRRLGTPKPGRQAARAGRLTQLQEIFAAHMQTPDAVAGLEAATSLASSQTICLLCFERDPHSCHRSIVAAMIHRRTGLMIRHL